METKMMYFYDRTGTLVDTRPMRPDERQMTIVPKEGTNE